MKSTTMTLRARLGWWWASLLGAFSALSTLWAADTNAPPAAPSVLTPEQMFEGGTNTYNNWIDLTVGGFVVDGTKSQFQQNQQKSGSAFGGFEDWHYQTDLAKGTTLSTDGRALFNEHDYKVRLDLVKEKTGFVRFSYDQYRTWYNGNGGFYPPTGAWFPMPDDGLHLDRGQVFFEAGLTLDNVPKVTFKYTHDWRDGEKSSTIWGLTHPAPDVTRGLSPSFYDINEHSDAFQLDATHHIKATDLGLGLRYETGKLDDALKITQFPGEIVQDKITDRQGTSYDLFNVHAFTETWFKKNLMLSSGFSYTDLKNDFSGSRIYGNDFDVNYVPAAQNGFGYYGLSGSSHLHEYVVDLNLMTIPLANFAIVPSVRFEKDDSDASAAGFETLGASPAVPFSGNSDTGILDVRERLDLTYHGVTNWVFYARVDLTEGNGNLSANGGLVPVGGIGVPPIQQQTDDRRFFQKYSAGARWYPARAVTVDFGGYYKLNHYGYGNNLDSTPNGPTSPNRYPAYLVLQDFETYDDNARLTLRPLKNVTLISRYEYQLSTIHTEPDPISGLDQIESSKMTSQILAQDVSWAPWSRLYLQAGFNYVLSKTKTPGSEVVQGILDAQNNYWTLNFSAGFVLNDKTDLNLGYFYYEADNYHDNSDVGVPLGAGGHEHGVTATLTRRISKNMSLLLRYGYYNYEDQLSGGNNNFNANAIYTTLRYRF
jgi:hypothetical protein